MSSTMRGVSTQIPVRGVRLTTFAGRAVSGFTQLQPQFPLLPDIQPPDILQPDKLRYDTNVFGAYATSGSSAVNAYRPGQILSSAL